MVNEPLLFELLSFDYSKEDTQEEPQSQNLAHQWHEEEEQINNDGQHTYYTPVKSHYKNKPIQIYWIFCHQKMKSFR